MGNGEWGMGNREWGMGRWAWGIGHWLFFLLLPPPTPNYELRITNYKLVCPLKVDS